MGKFIVFDKKCDIIRDIIYSRLNLLLNRYLSSVNSHIKGYPIN